jgi:biotin-(acetyl-CoA carboxylase) ligase
MPEELLKTINQPATSLGQLSGRLWNLDEILEELLQQFVADFAILNTQGFAAFQKKYQRLLAFKGQRIRCFDGIKSVEGICHGILSDGRLELLLPNEEKIYLSAGEVLIQSR